MPIKPSSRWTAPTRPRPQAKLRAVLGELRRAGKKILTQTAGDPPLWGHINQPLSKYLIEAAEKGYHSYGGPANDQGSRPTVSLRKQLQDAIASYEKKERGLDFNSNDIFPCGGCSGALMTIHHAMLEEKDEVVALEPAHYLVGPTSYFPCFKAKVVPCRKVEENDWDPDLDELREKISDKTKAIMINHPNNPTGKVYDEKTLKNITDIAGEYDIPILSDEIYALTTFEGFEIKSVADVAGDVSVIVVNGMSKIFMRTGWRIGYLAFHDPEEKIKDLIDTTRRVWSAYGHQAHSIPVPIYYAATKAFENPTDAGSKFVRNVKQRTDYSMKRINEIDGLSCVEPKATFYVFPRIEAIGKTWESDIDFLIDIAKEEHVTFNPGSQYGEHGSGHFRSITLPNIDILEEVYNRVEKFMKKHTA